MHRIPLLGCVEVYDDKGVAQLSHTALLLPNTHPAKVLTIAGARPQDAIKRGEVMSTVVLSKVGNEDVTITASQARRLVQGKEAAARRKNGTPVVLALVKDAEKLLPR